MASQNGLVASDRVRRWLEGVASAARDVGPADWDSEAAAELAVSLPAPSPPAGVLAPPAEVPFAALRDALETGDALRAQTSARWLLHLLAPDDPLRRPTLSVVIPVYNAPELARRSVESALAQTWSPLEVVVVDDGSEPPLDLGELASRVKLVRQPNRGASAARNTGVAEARGDWVHFLDADDAFFPDALETQWAALRTSPGAEVCVSRYRSEGGDPGSRGAHGPPFGDEWCPTRDLLATWVRRYPFQTSTLLLPRWLLAEVGSFEEAFPQGEDARYWFRLALRGTRVAAVDAPLVARRFRAGSLSASESAYGPILFTLALIALLEDFARWPYVDALAERMQGRERWQWLDRHDDPWLERLRGELLAAVGALPAEAHAVAAQLRARIAGPLAGGRAEAGDAFLAQLDVALHEVEAQTGPVRRLWRRVFGRPRGASAPR
jgi:glycosyltransferase involved in cell wall biosynthesis